MYARRRVLDAMRGVPLKCFSYVSSEITETPAPVSNYIRREVPLTSTGIMCNFCIYTESVGALFFRSSNTPRGL